MSSDPETPTPDPQPTEITRPLARDGGQARSESELWELDHEENGTPAASAENLVQEDERRESVRKWVAGPLEKQPAQKKENRKRTEVRLDIQPRGVTRPIEQIMLPAKGVERKFSSLDDWEEDLPIDAAPSNGPEETNAVSMDEPVVPEPEVGLEEAIASEESPPQSEEPSKPSRPTVGPVVPMNRIEWAGLGVLAVLICALVTGAYFWSIRLLPEETPRWKQVSFPVKGERFEIKNATTYWRAPVLEGPNMDPIRRGTRLIPIVELELAGGPAALRVIFRDDEGRGVGDPIIRYVPSSGKLALAATAGFEDPGMHAAYRTEELDPWSVEVSEAAEVDAPGGDFSLILKMNLSSDLR